MKKANVLRLVLSVTLAAFLLCGCRNSKEAPAEEAPEVTAEEVTEENEVEEEEKEQESVEEETSADMPEAQVTTTVENIDGLVAYIQSLDPKTPHIVIYNEAEGYIIDMKEGEHYQLKKDDRLFLNSNDRIKERSHSIPEKEYIPILGGGEVIPDYSKFDSPHETRFKIVLKDDPSGERIKLTCYLDAPSE